VEAPSKLLWGITLASAAVGCFFVLGFALHFLAMEWSLYVVLSVGVALSIAGLIFTRGVASGVWRYISYCGNGCVLVFHLLLACLITFFFINTIQERILIPDRYAGDVYILYGVQDGEVVSSTRWAVTYRIPTNGVLRVRGVAARSQGWVSEEYYYVTTTGHLKRIRDVWFEDPTRTPENLNNDKDVGISFGNSSTSTDSKGCTVDYDQFYVGTKAQFLNGYRARGLPEYLRDHPVCPSDRR
jgi:hypothetical protein